MLKALKSYRMDNSRRLTILTNQEIEALYGLPCFDDEERSFYFDLSPAESLVFKDILNRSVAVHFVLQCGYFKAKRRFFTYTQEVVQNDVSYILQRYFPDRALNSVKALSKPIRLEHQKIILKLFDYRLCKGKEKEDVKQKSQRIAMISTQPLYILREILEYLSNQGIVAPWYTFLQDLVSQVLSIERKRITDLLDKAITLELTVQLESMLQADESLYQITILKHEPKDFSYKELRQEVERRIFFQPLYQFAQGFLTTAGFSAESIKY